MREPVFTREPVPPLSPPLTRAALLITAAGPPDRPAASTTAWMSSAFGNYRRERHPFPIWEHIAAVAFCVKRVNHC